MVKKSKHKISNMVKNSIKTLKMVHMKKKILKKEKKASEGSSSRKSQCFVDCVCVHVYVCTASDVKCVPDGAGLGNRPLRYSRSWGTDTPARVSPRWRPSQ